ncbi:MAG: hypothetical protein WC299_00235 [Kiritimatiellia bacterium]
MQTYQFNVAVGLIIAMLAISAATGGNDKPGGELDGTKDRDALYASIMAFQEANQIDIVLSQKLVVDSTTESDAREKLQEQKMRLGIEKGKLVRRAFLKSMLTCFAKVNIS